MPTVMTLNGYRFFFYSHEGSEPAHIHVEKGGDACKLWLVPISIAWNRGFGPRQLKSIRIIIKEHHERLLEAWNDRH